ncbi:transglutaminase TgpA family protein [Streptomyces phaeoluteigriseus]|uniref:transglutaminase TgpA family protein n=1 Tax=Streptomyces phaeoluteigriseus TaxID=114686 RepID=UPI00369D194E
MSGRARLTLCSVAATLMAASALLPLVQQTSWILVAAFLLAVQSAVGAVTRRVPLARPLTVLAQTLVTLVLLTLVFAREQALAGLIPGPQALQHFVDLLQSGTDDVGRYAIPAPLSDGIRLMMIGGVLVIGLAVDTLAVTYRNAAPAGLPLLALYSVAAGLSDGGTDWLWFLVAGGGYLMLLLAEGRERLSQWGRVFGGAPRDAGRQPGPVAPVRTGRRIGAAALGVALAVPLLPLPAIDGGLLGGTGTGVGSGTGGGGTISAVNPLVSLRDSLNVDEDRTVLTLRTNTGDLSDLYLRIVSLDDFDGTTWKPSQRDVVAVPDDLPTPPGLGADVRRAEITTRVAAADWYAQDWLPMPYPPSGVQVSGRWRYEPVGMTVVGDHRQTTRGKTYEVKSLQVQPTAKQLASAPAARGSLRGEYTEVPDTLPAVVSQRAREITEGSSNDYERAVKLQEWFAVTGGFEYDTEVKVGTGRDAIARFLRDKQGFCVHFSFAMAAMARTLGIPARVAVGFAPGSQQSDGSVAVSLKDAHAWPELYFEGVGWTRFEPTPTRGSTPPYTLPDTPGSTVPDLPQASRSADAAASAEPSASTSCTSDDKRLQGCTDALPVDEVDRSGGGPPWYKIAGWTVLGLASLVVLLLPMLWRLRRRSVRLASAQHTASAAVVGAGPGTRGEVGQPTVDGGPAVLLDVPSEEVAEAAVAHVLAVWRELTDTAWDYGIPPDDALTPRRAAARIVRLGELDEAVAGAVHRVAGAVEQVLFAPQPRAAAGLPEEVRKVRVALRARAGRRARLRAVVAPRSAIRVVWDLSDRWTAVKATWSARLATVARRVRPGGRAADAGAGS